MRFTVEWAPGAEADLAALWADNVPLRAAISQSSRQIDFELATDAHRKGVMIDNYRTLRVAPLIVLYEVVVDDVKARVLQLRLPEQAEGQP